MYTQCPSCATVFRIEDDAVTGASAQVRCRHCRQRFDARDRLVAGPSEPGSEPGKDGLPQPAATRERRPQRQIDWTSGPVPVVPGRPRGAPPPQPSTPRPQERDADAHRRGVAATPGTDDTSRISSGQTPDVPAPAVAADDPMEAPAHTAARLAEDWQELYRQEIEAAPVAASPRRLWWYPLWLAGIVALLVTLAVQAAYIKREDLAMDPRWRPWVDTLCTVAGCQLPLMRDVGQLRLLHGQVSAHAEIEGALVATASLVNAADFRQPYPLLGLTLLDDGREVAGEGWYHPEDYLGDSEQRDRWHRGMVPGVAVRVRVVLEDPGSGAHQYVFDLR
ncbi:DUF3426 domain-containing protein [Aquisalimonas sp.]|uniref:DUF3426 domain-containing protein n=1 Tax=Aquisalimonas sp. TaxID=1872621 RepID=UPI0025B97F43|nr:DUF3426 domain-containing protein [Aquisalimonas sp.]